MPRFGQFKFGEAKFGKGAVNETWKNIMFMGIPLGLSVVNQLAKKVTYRISKIQQKYKYTVSSNPQSPAQQSWRSHFRDAVHNWQNMSEIEKESWETKAIKNRKMRTGYTEYISFYMFQKSKERWL